MAYCILSCDGGGIRGLLPALIVQKLAADVPSFLGHVNLFAGTSAGAFVSLGLACDLPISQIVTMFATNGAQIFQPYTPTSSIDPFWFAVAQRYLSSVATSDNSWWSWVISHLDEIINEIMYVKYTNTGLQQLLASILPSKTMGELSHSAMVTTFQLDDPVTGNWAPIKISNLPNDPGGATFPIDAALSTSAAPTYFPPYQHPTFGYCADGGVYANNPGSMAIAAAMQAGVPLSEIVMLSLGTGAAPENIQITPPPTNYGPLAWMMPIAVNSTPAMPIMSVLMDGVSSADAFICQQLLGARYLRLQVPLPSPMRLDDYQNVPLLQNAAAQFMTTPEWAQAEVWVSQMFTSSQWALRMGPGPGGKQGGFSFA
jgi:uncharacterized protein